MRIAFDRPEVRNAFRPHTVDELYRALDHARMTPDVGCVLLTGNGPVAKDGGWAFCSGGDQRIRGRRGYQYADGETADTVDPARARRGRRLHILEVQRLIRTMPKVVVAVVPGWAAGGGHSPARRLRPDHRQRASTPGSSRPTPTSGRSTAGYGSAYLAKMVGPEVRPRDLLPRPRRTTPRTMHRMGAVNEVVPPRRAGGGRAASGRAEINGKSPDRAADAEVRVQPRSTTAWSGQQVFAGEATRLAYMTDEAVEGRDAFLEKRDPDWSPFPWYF